MSDEKKPRCFVIMPISDQPGYLKGHFSKVYDQIFKVAIDDAGYEPYRVDEDNICDSIILKIFDGIQNCEMALCDLSSRNPNVLYELGLRQAYDKPVVLVQDEKTERIFDVSGINTIPYNSDRLYESVIEARQRISQALKDSKNGKGYSLIKLVKANEAKFPEGDLPKNEKTEIMLDRIMVELSQIKQDRKIKNDVFMPIDYNANDLIIKIATLESQVDEVLKSKDKEALSWLTIKACEYMSEIVKIHENTVCKDKLINKIMNILDNLKDYKEKSFDL